MGLLVAAPPDRNARPMTTAFPSPRRHFLLGLGCLGASAAAGARPAAALQVMPTGDYAALVDSACGVTSAHQRLLQEARAQLGASLSQDRINAALTALRCPVCGCPLITVAAADSPPPAAPPSASEAVRHEQ